ncbi:MAG: DUF3048 domain-containing protein [Acidimicrobiales bacterium]
MAASGCSEKKAAGQRPTAPPVTGPSTTTLPPAYPLTGRPVGEPNNANRGVVSVKIDNASAARPQAGIGQADLVYEEFTEGITRFIVVFHSTDAEVIGPVRSVRPADPAIVTPLGGLLAFSGGSAPAVELATSSPLATVTEGDTEILRRRSGRFAPHNLYTSSAALYSRVPGEAKAPPKFAEFLPPGRDFTAAGATPFTHLTLVPAPFVTADYDWYADSRTWKRATDGAPHMLEDGGQIEPSNVIVQYTPYPVWDADSAVQNPEVIGSGDALVFAAGVQVTATWSKPTPDAVTTFTDAAGAPIVLPPGQTWVHLVPPGTPIAAT